MRACFGKDDLIRVGVDDEDRVARHDDHLALRQLTAPGINITEAGRTAEIKLFKVEFFVSLTECTIRVDLAPVPEDIDDSEREPVFVVKFDQ